MNAPTAIRTPAPYIGGKRNLAKRLCAIIDAQPHRTYAEPFVGMGGIFLRRSSRPAAEVINDLSSDVANLFRIAKRHYQPLVDELQWMPACREEFERLKRVDPTTLTDIERAARFLYLQRLAFGGKVVGRGFGVARDAATRFNAGRVRADLALLHTRLERVVVEQLPYADLIRRYDGAGTLFYLDPPYWGSEGDYGADAFGRDDFAQLADQLAGIAGKFILSINATEGSREVFGRFNIEDVDTTWTIGTGNRAGAKKVTELIVRNF
ncbi:DNA adenine methylase [Sphingomonas sp. 3-13AW]|uniref:DNA adenine methylase n=1 Tax=Sphingomonas sp. 3-13AW TaxID=3050450 RepID=UPI003BB784DE